MIGDEENAPAAQTHGQYMKRGERDLWAGTMSLCNFIVRGEPSERTHEFESIDVRIDVGDVHQRERARVCDTYVNRDEKRGPARTTAST